MPFVVSLYHRIKRQISRRDRPRTHQRSHIRPAGRLRQALLRIRRRLQSDRLGRLRSLIKCALYVYFTIEHALLSPPKYTSRFIVGFFFFAKIGTQTLWPPAALASYCTQLGEQLFILYILPSPPIAVRQVYYLCRKNKPKRILWSDFYLLGDAVIVLFSVH